MFVISHTALPIIAAGCFNLRAIKLSTEPVFSRLHFFLIGFCGMLPDLLTPHLSLHSRLNSWSHTLWFFFPFMLGCLVLARHLHPRHHAAAHCCWGAILLHLLCDGISGGIHLLPPFGQPIGDYLIPVRYWLQLDLVCMIGAYFVCWRGRHLMLMQGMQKPGQPDPEPGI